MDIALRIVVIPIAVALALICLISALTLTWGAWFTSAYGATIPSVARADITFRSIIRWPGPVFWVINASVLWGMFLLLSENKIASMLLFICCPCLNSLWGYLLALQEIRTFRESEFRRLSDDFLKFRNKSDEDITLWKEAATKDRNDLRETRLANEILTRELFDAK